MKIQGKSKLVLYPGNIFFLSYGLYLVVSILATSMFYRYIEGLKINILLGICILLVLEKEILTKNNRKIFLGILSLTIISLVLFMLGNVTGGYNSPIFLIMFILSARNIDFNKIAKFTIVISSVTILFVIGAALVEIIPNYTFHAYKGTVSYLGFKYSLYPAAYCSNITMLYLYTNKDKIKWKSLILLGGINYIIYELTISRLFFVTCLFMLIAMAVYKIIDRIPQIIEHLLHGSIIVYILIWGFSYVLCKYYDSNIWWMKKMNDLLEGRVELQSKILAIYPIKLLGQNITWVGNALNANGVRSSQAYFYADNLFINMNLMYGMIFTLVLVVLLSATMKKLYYQKQYFLMLVLILLAFHGLVDDLIQYLYYNTFLLLAGINLKTQYNQFTEVTVRNMEAV